jgi:hypothetical protein
MPIDFNELSKLGGKVVIGLADWPASLKLFTSLKISQSIRLG